MEFRNRFALGTLSFYLLIFVLVRLILYLLYNDYFSPLDGMLVLEAFIDGLRFDISMIFTFLGLPLFLMNLPINNRKWLKTVTFISSFLFLCMVLILSGDLAYFDVVKRHLGDDLMLAMNDPGFVVDFALKQYWFLVIIIFALFALYIRFLYKIINKNFIKNKIKPLKEILMHLAIILIIIVGIRGTLGDKPINIINAFGGGSSEYGNLTLNGVFCAYHFSRSSGDEGHKFLDNKQAQKHVENILIENDETVGDNQFPLRRKRNSFYLQDSLTEKKLNVVFILLESWTPKYIDSFSDEKFGVTPNFDKLAEGGIKFTNAYANADRSIQGITATLLSIPQIIGLPYLGTGLEVNNIFRLGKMLNNDGYRTIFGQTSSKGSYRVDAIAEGLGFKEFYAMQDFPIIYKYNTDEIPYFGWDYDGLMFLENKISEQKKPFFAYFFTGTTHEAYVSPGKKFEKYPHQRNGLNGYLNTLHYSDFAIGEFMKKAKTRQWFDNTIFIFVADHVCKFVSDDLRERFHVPMLIYAPALLKPKEVNFICSQADLPPTIFDLLGLNYNYSGIGKSLVRDYDYRFVIANRGKEMIYFDERGFINHNLEIVMKKYIKPEFAVDSNRIFKEMERNLLSTDQLLYNLLKSNKFYK